MNTATWNRTRDEEELRRSAEEANGFHYHAVANEQIERYRCPKRETPYPLEYAFHLMGDLTGKRVLDLGCGKGENLLPLAANGADVIGVDLSPELLRFAERRVEKSGLAAAVAVGSAYATGLRSGSVDAIFCAALVHHLEIPRVRAEMLRILKRGGYVVLTEPIRFSGLYNRLRSLLPAQGNISDYEHPLTVSEWIQMSLGFQNEGLRYFRLPFVPFLQRVLRQQNPSLKAWQRSAWLLDRLPGLRKFATIAVVRLRKP